MSVVFSTVAEGSTMEWQGVTYWRMGRVEAGPVTINDRTVPGWRYVDITQKNWAASVLQFGEYCLHCGSPWPFERGARERRHVTLVCSACLRKMRPGGLLPVDGCSYERCHYCEDNGYDQEQCSECRGSGYAASPFEECEACCGHGFHGYSW